MPNCSRNVNQLVNCSRQRAHTGNSCNEYLSVILVPVTWCESIEFKNCGSYLVGERSYLYRVMVFYVTEVSVPSWTVSEFRKHVLRHRVTVCQVSNESVQWWTGEMPEYNVTKCCWTFALFWRSPDVFEQWRVDKESTQGTRHHHILVVAHCWCWLTMWRLPNPRHVRSVALAKIASTFSFCTSAQWTANVDNSCNLSFE